MRFMMGGMNGAVNDSYSNSLRGMSGLGSGLDRDGMIKTMTMRRRSKIARYKQKLQKLQWRQEAYQGISDKMIEFSRKYLSVGSDQSLIRSNTFTDFSVEALGAYKDKITATGSPQALEGIQIMGISNKAINTQYVGSSVNGGNAIVTGEINMNEPVSYGAIENKTLDIKIGLKDGAREYQVKFVTGNYDIYQRNADGTVVRDVDGVAQIDSAKVDKVKELFKQSFENTEVYIGNNKYSMADFVKVDFEKAAGEKDYKVRIKVNEESTAGGSTPLGKLNAMHITGGTALKAMGMNPVGAEGFNINATEKGYMLSDTAQALVGGYDGSAAPKLRRAAELLAGSSITVTFNGIRKSIGFPEDVIPNADPNSTDVIVKKGGITYNLADANDVAKYLDRELKDAFGRNNISVNYDDSTKKMSFVPANGASLSIKSEKGHLLGEENGLKLADGASNRVDLDMSLRSASAGSNLVTALDNYAKSLDGKGYNSFAELLAGETKISFNINGNKIEILSSKVNKLSDLVNELNNDKNIVERGMTNGDYNSIFKVKYDSSKGAFVLSSADKGANSLIQASGALWDNTFTSGSSTVKTLEATLFGDYNAASMREGNDAVVFYKTADSDLVKQMTVSENSFQIGEARFTINGGFNVRNNGSGYELENPNAQAVTFKSNIKADELVEKVKNMIKDYNDITKLMGTSFKTMAERDGKNRIKYEPLTDEQKKEMTEKQIEQWEEKAKQGLLFGDTTLRGARDSLASVLYYTPESVALLNKIGITQSSYIKDPNGSLEFDEAKFRQALKDDPDLVKKAFVGTSGRDVGLANNMKASIARHASDTGVYKGSLVEMAGSKFAPATMFSNNVYKQIESMKRTISVYEARLKNDEDRYISRFAKLEKMMMKANMQAGYINNLQGY